MQKEIASTFGIKGKYINVDIRPLMGNGMSPDIVADSRNLPFESSSFSIILFDPPFSFHGGKSCGTGDYSRFYITYGLNLYTSRKELGDYISATFREIHRLLTPTGFCLLKWSESRIRKDWLLSLKPKNLYIGRKYVRPSKYKGTKTGTSTIYFWLVKGSGLMERVAWQ